MSSQYSDIRKQLESDEQLKILMAGLRGSNLNDSDYAEEGVTMSLVEVCMQWGSPAHSHAHAHAQAFEHLSCCYFNPQLNDEVTLQFSSLIPHVFQS